jgi:hypothetical protein
MLLYYIAATVANLQLGFLAADLAWHTPTVQLHMHSCGYSSSSMQSDNKICCWLQLRVLFSKLYTEITIFFLFCRRFSELFRYHKYETDTLDLKAFIEVIERMKQLEVLFPGQRTNDTSLDATSIDSDGSSSKPPDVFEEIDSAWVS